MKTTRRLLLLDVTATGPFRSLTADTIVKSTRVRSLVASAFLNGISARGLTSDAVIATGYTASTSIGANAVIEDGGSTGGGTQTLTLSFGAGAYVTDLTGSEIPLPPTTWAVNVSPGSNQELFQPTKPVFIGVRSYPGNIFPHEIDASFGISNLRHHGVLPEQDSILEDVSFTTPEGSQPVDGTVARGVSAGSLTLTKTNDTDYEQGIYEVAAPCATSSIAAYFRFKKKDWASFIPSWSGRTMHGLYFGLRDGTMNTGAYVFLREDGAVLLAGPVRASGTRSFSSATPRLPFPALVENATIELWIVINRVGLEHPFATPNVPVAEVWGTVGGGAPIMLHRVTASSLGVSGKRGSESKASIFFGNAGRTGDVLELSDWQLYPDFRTAIRKFEKMPNHSAIIWPDTPCSIWARDGKLPTEAIPARWFNIGGIESDSMTTRFTYQPGVQSVPQMICMDKTTVTPRVSGFEREEPRLRRPEPNADTLLSPKNGFLMEAFMASNVVSSDGSVFGAGFSVEDGSNIFRVATLKGTTRSGYGIHNGGALSELSGYYGTENGSSIPVDSLKVVRLTVDYHADKLRLDVDDERVVDRSLSTTLLPFSPYRRIQFGHLSPVSSVGQFNVASLLYVPNYETWDAKSSAMPTYFPYSVRGWSRSAVDAGSTVLMAADYDHLTIEKLGVNVPNSHNYFEKDTTFPDYPGILVDFGAKVQHYTNYQGEPFAPITQVGAGVKIWYGRRLELGFYSCGTAGRFIGIVPGSGTVNDILYQTELGRKFSAEVDWLQHHNYRIIIQSFKSIEVWVDGFHTEPAIVIPWDVLQSCFDLPPDSSTTPKIAFGHFGAQEASITWWSHFNYGGSNGYDIAMSQSYPDGLKPYHFNGKSLLFFSAKDTKDR